MTSISFASTIRPADGTHQGVGGAARGRGDLEEDEGCAGGVKLGGFRGHMPNEKTWESSVRSKQATAMKRAAEVAPTIRSLQANGATTLQAIADGLNELGVPTASGSGNWSSAQVWQVLKRIG